MISIQQASVRFPLPKRYREYAVRPFSRRRRLTALSEVSLELPTGNRVALLGPNGAGKTTLLKLIGGLLLPTEGKVFVNGRDTERQNRVVRRAVGSVLSDERSFFWRLTGMQNLLFFGALNNIYGAELRERCDRLVAFVGLQEAADMRVSNYSTGMKQLLAIARGLIADPEILILDEPTRALDPMIADEVVSFLLDKVHANAQKSLLIATHRLEDVRKLCNRVLIINKGRILSNLDLSELDRQGISLDDHYRRTVTAAGRKS
jgi:ABC-2 type transport system ATP-binding protein